MTCNLDPQLPMFSILHMLKNSTWVLTEENYYYFILEAYFSKPGMQPKTNLNTFD